MNTVLAQKINVGGQTLEGPLKGINTPADIVSKALPLLIGLATMILFFVLVWGGYGYLVSQGNPEKIKSAQARITTGIIGFVLLIISYVVVRLISTIFGIGGGIFQ